MPIGVSSVCRFDADSVSLFIALPLIFELLYLMIESDGGKSDDSEANAWKEIEALN